MAYFTRLNSILMKLQRDSAPNPVALIDEKDKALLVG
jgi:hypothetical protein